MAYITGDHRAICGIDRFEGRVWCWGDGNYQAVQVPELGTDNRQLAFTNAGYCVVRENGQLFCHTRVRVHPLLEGTILDGVHFTAQTCAVTDRGVECWGTNQDGVVRVPPTGSDVLHPPTLIQGLPGKVTHLARTSGAACALNQAGEVWCWGSNDDGQLGVGDFEFCPRVSEAPPGCTLLVTTPRRVALPEPITDLVEAGSFCTLGASGRVWCWGYNINGVVRSPSVVTYRVDRTAFRIEPIPVLNEGFGSDNVRLFGGSGNVCALKRDGSLWCNGDNRYSQVARPTVEHGYQEELPPHRMPVTCP